MNQTELAKKLKVSQQFISLVLAGDRRPSYRRAKEWAEATGIAVEVWMESDAATLRGLINADEKGGD